MTDKPKKIVSGRLELVPDWKGFILKFEEQEITGASWSEFLNLAKEILKHESNSQNKDTDGRCPYGKYRDYEW